MFILNSTLILHHQGVSAHPWLFGVKLVVEPSGDGVVAYPVMQVYGSLALEKRCWADVVFPAATALVPSSSQPKKPTHSLEWVLRGDDLVISPTCEVGRFRIDSRKEQLQKCLERTSDTSLWFLSLTLVNLEQSCLPDSQWCVASQVCSHVREIGTSLKDLSPPWPSWTPLFP